MNLPAHHFRPSLPGKNLPNPKRRFSWAALVLCAALGVSGAESPLTLLTASFWGTDRDDDIQGAAAAPDGTVYVVGNTGEASSRLPGGIVAKVFGQPAAEPRCGRALVAHFNADLTRLLHYTELAEGIAILSSAPVNSNGANCRATRFIPGLPRPAIRSRM